MSRSSNLSLVLAYAAIVGLTAACDEFVDDETFEVLATLPHDPAAYTQGILFHDGFLYESTGRYGESDLRRVDPATGEVLDLVPLDDSLFAEGLAMTDEHLIQLTWKAGKALVYDPTSLEVIDTLRYEGEGWGLCYDGTSLFMSDGSGRLVRRDPGSFAALDTLTVTKNGFSTRNLNELECVGESIYANVFLSDEILRIDKTTGAVVGSTDGYSLSVSSGRPQDVQAVLNGIAWDPSSQSFYLTGKLWPTMYHVTLSGTP